MLDSRAPLHLTFPFYVAGAAAVSVARLARRRESPARAALALSALYAPTLLALAALTWIDLREIARRGGDPIRWALLASRSVGYTLGLPVSAALAWPALACAAALGVAGRLSWRAGDDDWLLAGDGHRRAGARARDRAAQGHRADVFVIGIALYLVLLSRLAATLIRAGGWRRAACAVALALFASERGAHGALPSLRSRRHRQAVAFMAASSPSAAFSVGSDHDFRNEMVLRFYARRLPEGRSLTYASAQSTPPAGPDWVIFHVAVRPENVPPTVADRLGNEYRFAREFDCGGISGFWGASIATPRPRRLRLRRARLRHWNALCMPMTPAKPAMGDRRIKSCPPSRVRTRCMI